MQIPHITTDRLLLREYRDSDHEPYAAMCADAETMRFLGDGSTISREQAWRSLAFMAGHWQLRGFGMWAVEERATGEFIGRVGFLQPDGWPGFEIGWTIDRRRWGQGFATEAAKAVLPRAFSEYGQTHVISLIRPENLASIRVAEKLGETREREMDFHGAPVLVYGVSRESWNLDS